MSRCAHCGQDRGESWSAELYRRGFDPLTHCEIAAIYYGGIVPCEGFDVARICHLCAKGRNLGTWTPVNHGSAHAFTPKGKIANR